MSLPNPEFKKKFKIYDNRNKMFLVNSFAQIGWADPFAHESEGQDDAKKDQKESIQIPDKFRGNAYDESRYIEGFNPTVIYIPNIEVMLKIMRSCIGVTDARTLWVFNDPNVEIW